MNKSKKNTRNLNKSMSALNLLILKALYNMIIKLSFISLNLKLSNKAITLTCICGEWTLINNTTLL